MNKLGFEDRNILVDLFANPTSAILLSCFYKDIGEVWISDKSSAEQCSVIFVDHTIYIGGQYIDKELEVFLLDQMLKSKLPLYYIIPQDCLMISYFDEIIKQGTFIGSLIKSERHLMEIDMNHLNHDTLTSFIHQVPENYQLKPIGQDLFSAARNGDPYLNNFIKLYNDYTDFEKNGFGYFLLNGTKIIAGISSYARYENGVEVQIAVSPDYRGQHLARSLGAKFILECERRNLYPWWDCANPTSEHIAMELGYRLKQVTPIYKWMLQ